MKVVLLNTLYAPNVLGGTERVVQTLAESLLARGHQPVVICTGASRGVTLERVGDVPVYSVGLQNVYPLLPPDKRRAVAKPIWHAVDTLNVGMMNTLGRILDNERPAVMHTHNLTGFSAMAWSAAHDRGIPIVHTLHDYYLLCPRSTMFANGVNCERQHVTCTLYSWPRVRLSLHVRAVVGVSRFVLDRHLAHGAFPRAEPFLIGNPCVSAVTSPPLHDATPPRFRIGFLGRLEQEKGVEELLTAAVALPREGWELHIAGRGTNGFDERLRSRFVDPRIRFHGFVDRDEFLSRIDVLVVPSLSHETFGLVAIEAFAFGVPVIASRRGGLSEVVTDGVDGALFDPSDPSALRTVLSRFVAEPSRASEMRAACLARARDFSVETITERYEAVYQRVM